MKDRFTPNHIESLEDNEVFNLQRFLDAQSHCYQQALQEVKDGRKRSHWIWYIFPQLAILGHSIMQSIMVSAGTMRLRHINDHKNPQY